MSDPFDLSAHVKCLEEFAAYRASSVEFAAVRELLRERAALLEQVAALQAGQTAQLLLARSSAFEAAALACEEAARVNLGMSARLSEREGEIVRYGDLAARECARVIRALAGR